MAPGTDTRKRDPGRSWRRPDRQPARVEEVAGRGIDRQLDGFTGANRGVTRKLCDHGLVHADLHVHESFAAQALYQYDLAAQAGGGRNRHPDSPA